MIKLKIDAQGHYCNHWPTLVVYHNKELICSLQIQEQESIQFDLEPKEDDNLTFAHPVKVMLSAFKEELFSTSKHSPELLTSMFV